jgi:hypothetical protein
LFSDTDPESGIGGWGTLDNDYQITKGAFSHGFQLAYPIPHRLRRNYTETYVNPRTGVDTGAKLLPMLGPDVVEAAMNQEEFLAFQVGVEASGVRTPQSFVTDAGD